MSSAGLTQPLTARMFLAGDSSGPDTAELIAKSLRERGIAGSAIGGVRRLSTSALEAVHDEIDTVADGFLDLELGDVLVSGWRKYTELVNAAERTLAVPGSKEVVVLASHRVSSIHHPSIELLVDEVKVYTLVFELTVEFNLTGVVAVVQQGELTALRGGECELTVTLALEKKPLLPPRKAHVDLALVVALSPAIPLLRDAEDHP
ncbi:MAG: hypothetical protein ACRDSL_25945 [Pseudonocardiaceae bacterium]